MDRFLVKRKAVTTSTEADSASARATLAKQKVRIFKGKFRDAQLIKNKLRQSQGNTVQTQSELLVNKLKQTVTNIWSIRGW